MQNKKLERLYRNVDRCVLCGKSKNRLRHIHGVGALQPRLMLVLINPTHRNLSGDPSYRGPRFPFIGVRQFWRVLADGGLVARRVAYALPPRSEWKVRDTEAIAKEVTSRGLFITNVVKCCSPHGDYPTPRVVSRHVPLLREELRAVRPKRIVAFGAFPFRVLTGKPIRLSAYWNGNQRARYRETISGFGIPVLPVYFPVGRGNPKKAAKILRRIVSE